MAKNLTIVSWNVNGIRACSKKGFTEWLTTFKPDICCIQESKAQREQLDDEVLSPKGYTSHWASAERKGYSGVALYIKNSLKPDDILVGTGVREYDSEGRTISLVLGKLKIVNCYFPNSRHDHSRLDYKIAYNEHMLEYTEAHRQAGGHVLICGDFNVAHKEIDLKNPKRNVNNPGFLPEERSWMSRFLETGYIDTFRHFYPEEEGQYSWWSYRFNARAKNVGWRIDYFCMNMEMEKRLKGAAILKDVMGSDHCPVSVKIARE